MKREWVQAFEQVKLQAESFAEQVRPFYAQHNWKLYNPERQQLEIPTADAILEVINSNIDALVEHAADENFNGFSEVESGCILVRATNYPVVGPQISVALVAEDLWSYGEEGATKEAILN